MKTTNVSASSILARAERLGYTVQECTSFEGCYFIIETNTNLIIAGAQEFLAWEEVVRWVEEIEIGPTLH